MLWLKSHLFVSPPDDAPVGQADTYYASREALRCALGEATGGDRPTWPKLALENYQKLPHYPGLIASLAHSGRLGLAALGEETEFLGLGVDLELATRPIEERARRHFFHPDDQLLGSLLALWVAKEASFKALWRLRPMWEKEEKEEGFYLKDICVRFQDEDRFEFYPARAMSFKGEGKLWAQDFPTGSYLIGQALIYAHREKASH